MDYDRLITEGLTTPFEGWDFGVFQGRFTAREDALPWDYRRLVTERLSGVDSLLDLGTGGGELLSSLAPLPARTAATEGFAPNVPIARRRLTPLGIAVAEVGDDDLLPFPDHSFDLITSRHESYDPAEIRRVLAPGGVFLTQQVGGRDLAEVNQALGAPPHAYLDWDLAAAAAQLADAGFEVTWRAEAHVPAEFHDVGALVLFLRITPWQVPDFTVERYAERLRAVHEDIRPGRPLAASCHRFALVARVRA
ncbi:class I SAM-dependent methyltransferase [Goodfellowiella coeruleoviolacea]|uniref:Methyltransferase domain-containing protein n=1 Tax=Goodfellowiella coeruleoviolacea TaxID=334858 RepID=A0AAE3GEZ4_9PSEU|nr:class I SAM-dependent methyltransferase [Goodfellowiella coeruleoviolacea]MCP2167027.1 Methyltransferase domain-containing protein [Goodfellowiella coeruleoviolacea]